MKKFFCERSGDNTEKILVHQFLEEPNKIAAGGLGGVGTSQSVQGDVLLKAWVQSRETFFFFRIKHAKTVIVKVNIG